MRAHWQRINEAVDSALAGITLEDLARPQAAPAPLVQLGPGLRRAAAPAGR